MIPVHRTTPIDKPRKGLRLNVYRAVGLPDCTLGGITSKAANVTATTIREIGVGQKLQERSLPRDSRVYVPEPDAPETVLVIQHRPRGQRWLHLEPADHPGRAYMSGGNYAGSYDSRWTDIAGTDLLPVHDRHERQHPARDLPR